MTIGSLLSLYLLYLLYCVVFWHLFDVLEVMNTDCIFIGVNVMSIDDNSCFDDHSRRRKLHSVDEEAARQAKETEKRREIEKGEATREAEETEKRREIEDKEATQEAAETGEVEPGFIASVASEAV